MRVVDVVFLFVNTVHNLFAQILLCLSLPSSLFLGFPRALANYTGHVQSINSPVVYATTIMGEESHNVRMDV